jgi:predicted PurR-regulated permease PerM
MNKTTPISSPSPSGDSTEVKPPESSSVDTTGTPGAAASEPFPRPSTKRLPILRRTNVNRFTVIALLALLTVAMYPIVKIFIVPVIVAATLATLFYPLYAYFLKVFRNNKGVSSFVCCLSILLCLIAPTYFMVNLVVHQGVDLYQSAGPMVKDVLTKGNKSELLMRIKALPAMHWIEVSPALSVPLNEAIQKLVTVGTNAINKTSAGLLEFAINIFVMFFTMFYFFMDGGSLVKRLKYIVPIRHDYADMIIARFLLISRATVLGTVIIAVIQGALGALTLLIFGVKLWLMWGLVMGILSLMPFVGSSTVLVPTGIIKIILGDVGAGIGIICISVLGISNLDNFIRPRIVGGSAKLHDLVIFFSSLGGIAVFGPLGFIVGPVIAALFVAVLDIYELEFKQQLGENDKL